MFGLHLSVLQKHLCVWDREEECVCFHLSLWSRNKMGVLFEAGLCIMTSWVRVEQEQKRHQWPLDHCATWWSSICVPWLMKKIKWQTEYQTEIKRVWEVRRQNCHVCANTCEEGHGRETICQRERHHQMAVSSPEVDNCSPIYSNHLLIVLQLQGITGPLRCKSSDIHSPQWLHSTLH